MCHLGYIVSMIVYCSLNLHKSKTSNNINRNIAFGTKTDKYLKVHISMLICQTALKLS